MKIFSFGYLKIHMESSAFFISVMDSLMFNEDNKYSWPICITCAVFSD